MSLLSIVSDPQPSPRSVIAPALDLARIPSHIAIIMGGNGRWAAARGLPRVPGHRTGLDGGRRAVEGGRGDGVRGVARPAVFPGNGGPPGGGVGRLGGAT